MPKCSLSLVGSGGALPYSPTLTGAASVTSAPLLPSSQAFLTKVWWGKMCVDNGLWRVVACMLFFPLLYTSLITFRYFLQPGHACTKAGWGKLQWHLPGPHFHHPLPPAGRRGCSPRAA